MLDSLLSSDRMSMPHVWGIWTCSAPGIQRLGLSNLSKTPFENPKGFLPIDPDRLGSKNRMPAYPQIECRYPGLIAHDFVRWRTGHMRAPCIPSVQGSPREPPRRYLLAPVCPLWVMTVLNRRQEKGHVTGLRIRPPRVCGAKPTKTRPS